MNSIRATKTCFVQHWHQRKAGRSRSTIAFLFLQDSWCLHQQNAEMPSIPCMCLSHECVIAQISSPQGLSQRFYLLQPLKSTMNLQVSTHHWTRQHLNKQHKDLPERAQHSQPRTQAVISQREKVDKQGWVERASSHTGLDTVATKEFGISFIYVFS